MADLPEDSGAQPIEFPQESSAKLPTLLSAVKDARATRELLFTLRHFHLGDPSAKEWLEPVGDDYLPALLNPFRDASKLRYNYPLLLYPPETGDGEQNVAQLARPLSRFLKESVKAFAPDGESARILMDNLPWIERHLRQVLEPQEQPVEPVALLSQAGEALQDHLRLDEDNRTRLQACLEKLLESVPAGSRILGYGRYAAIHLLTYAIRSRVHRRRARFQEQIDQYIRGLKTLLEVERSKSDESIEPRMARESMGVASSRFDAGALSEVMDHSRGTKAMRTERRERIENALQILEQWQPDPVLVRFVHLGKLADLWLQDTPAFEALSDTDPCARATEIFDQQAAELSKVFSAARIAQLEIHGIYQPAIHDPWFANFNWEGFSQDELWLVPAVIALESADRIAGEGMRSFSRLLSSGRPVQILVRVRPHSNPGASPEENPFQNYRTELGYLGISHRQAVVAQSSAARYVHLLQCFFAALAATRTSLHIINIGLRPLGSGVALNAWLVAGAALESRAHPFFRINPEAGDVSAARMDFRGNPQPERDWPVHPFRYVDENETLIETELAFTFADYALLLGRLGDHFRVIPPECDSDALVPVAEYLSMNPDEAHRQVPFIWAVDGGSVLHRLVVSQELVLACRDRQNYWRALQELAGIRNRYVELAVEKTRAEEQANAAAERARLEAEHAAEVERVRTQAAGEAMQRLADTLLGLDLSTSSAMPVIAAAPARERALADEAGSASNPEPNSNPDTTCLEKEKIEQEEVGLDEPWIDSILCTSCNDCTNLNPQLFVYNDNKQAVIADPTAGTYAQLVEAAELCPANCIHPGSPLNPDESGVEELMLRAAPYG